MSISREKDRWSELNSREAVRDAAERLRQMSDTGTERIAREHWLDLLAPSRGEQIVDVGAGIGDMTLPLAKRVGPDGIVHALDLSSGLLEYTKRRADEAEVGEFVVVRQGDARELPYGDGEFDTAFSRWLLLHVVEQESVVVEMRRVVRPGGRVCCVEADWETLSVHPGDPEITRRIVDANVKRQVDGRVGRKLVSLMRSVGLRDVEVRPVVSLDLRGDWLFMLESRLEVASNAGVSDESLKDWWSDVEPSVENGEYFLGFTQYGVVGTVPA